MITKRRSKRNNTRKTDRKTKKNKVTLESQKKLVLNMLRELKWPKTARPNVLRQSHVMAGKSGYEGFVLGIVTSWAGKGSRAGYRKMLSMKTREPKYKKLFNESKKLMRLKDPKFNLEFYNKLQELLFPLKKDFGEIFQIGPPRLNVAIEKGMFADMSFLTPINLTVLMGCIIFSP